MNLLVGHQVDDFFYLFVVYSFASDARNLGSLKWVKLVKGEAEMGHQADFSLHLEASIRFDVQVALNCKQTDWLFFFLVALSTRISA